MRLKSKWLFALNLLALGIGCEADVSDEARAKRVTIEEELIGGPGALGGVGDYLLENSKIRVIIQDKGWSRGFGIFGGGIIDADIVRASTGTDGRRAQGKDSFGEFFPAFFLQAFEVQEIYPYNTGVIDAPLPAIEVIRSGKSGEPAIIRTRARGGDFLRTLSLVNDLVFPDKIFKKVRFETDYILHPGASHVEIRGRVVNEGSSRVNLTESASALIEQFNIPVAASTDGDSTFRLPVGDIALFGSGNSVFTPGAVAVTASETGLPRGFGLRYALESTWKLQTDQGVQLPAIQGLVVDFIATKGDGVSYGFAVADDENNYVWKYREQYEKEGGAPVSKHSLLIPFLFSSFTGAYYGLPPDELGAGESYEYTKYLVVGDGDGGGGAGGGGGGGAG